MEEVTCNQCGKEFLRPPNRIHEATKFGWKQYCSIDCHSRSKSKSKLFRCRNINCSNFVKRAPNKIESSGKIFCSQSCAAKVNNTNRLISRKKSILELNYVRIWKKCIRCNKEFFGAHRKYCSMVCSRSTRGRSAEEYKPILINKIKEFYKSKGRIPFKQEMWGIYGAARKVFGTWNNAIVAAGYKPNPVKFALKYIANDGHKCDSLAEKIIDDWFFARKIKHQTKVPYGLNRMTADFKVGDIYIEFFGLVGEIKRYDELFKIKQSYLLKNKLKTIAIYPNDLLPTSKLDSILGKLIS